ncbi:MAG: ABC transporter substrate-binding protein, partial [Armatimonadia bacterium]|nr:ABC transporter substrate-binding protein [Armatimonadia bacterium]
MRTLMEQKRLLFALIAIVAVMVLIAGCPSGEEEVVPPDDMIEPDIEADDTADQSADPIKIGGIFATTGPASSLGEPEANTALMLMEQINADGGVDGREIEILIRDTKGQETEGLTVVKELIDKENVVAIVGPSRSGTTMAIIEEIQSSEIPLISCAAARAITEPVKEWVFNTPQSDEDAVTKIYDYLNAEGMS